MARRLLSLRSCKYTQQSGRNREFDAGFLPGAGDDMECGPGAHRTWTGFALPQVSNVRNARARFLNYRS
jgi:hypothetical protein